ncbi:MAG: tetratricopeptide repeat protein, partial [Treponema sp.]|nr:tetratricopeptide repeat protein [Treponema sp.]
DRLENLSASASLKSYVRFLHASEKSSAYKLLDSLKASSGGQNERLSYEQQAVERYNFFICLGIMLLALSYLFGELSLSARKKSLFALLGFTSLCFTFTGCSASFNDRMRLLNGSLEWNRKEYPDATADFLGVMESSAQRGDFSAGQYALFNLATTYLVQGENEAAKERFEELYGDLPDNLRFALLYNLGILAHRNGDYDEAADFFRQALLIDGSNVDAKVNLELSIVGGEGKLSANDMKPVIESSHEGALESAVYSIIREQEEGQWKNMQSDAASGDSQDY